MRVFLSWSGNRSKLVAEAFKVFLETVIQATKPWISTGIPKGMKWDPEIDGKLKESKVGIICLTSDNLSEPWLLFEAGAISNTPDTRVCTFLLDIASEQVKPPLGTFQHTLFDKSDLLKLVRTINDVVSNVGGNALDEKTLTKGFELNWPELEAALKNAKAITPVVMIAKRNVEDLVSEVLETVRNIDRGVEDLSKNSRATHGFKLLSDEFRARDRTQVWDEAAAQVLKEGLTRDPHHFAKLNKAVETMVDHPSYAVLSKEEDRLKKLTANMGSPLTQPVKDHEKE